MENTLEGILLPGYRQRVLFIELTLLHPNPSSETRQQTALSAPYLHPGP